MNDEYENRFDAPFERAGEDAAEALEAAFERAGQTIEATLERAARTGELSFSAMTDAILRDLARITAERLVEGPINGAIDTALGSLPFFGARAEGGPVTAGGAYLVGERGPELFVPSGAGQIDPAGRTINVNITLGSGAEPRRVEQSEARISRALARAVAKGSRHL
jgi:hypothetical protein